MIIYCTGCQEKVEARLISGADKYPSRPDLAIIPFWECPACKAYVGCHYKTIEVTKPLGYLATPEIIAYRKQIHSILDPLWKNKDAIVSRDTVYRMMTWHLDYNYHTGEIKTVKQAKHILGVVKLIDEAIRYNRLAKYNSNRIVYKTVSPSL
jgi:hypothetical protein